MPYPPELLRHQLVAVSSSSLLTIVGIGALIYGLRIDADYATGFAAFGVVSILVGVPMAYLSTSWYRRAVMLVSSTERVPATAALVIERSFESTRVYAQVKIGADHPYLSRRVAVLTPTWEYTSDLGGDFPVGLIIEPSSKLLKAISTDKGMLWCIPHNVPLKRPSAL